MANDKKNIALRKMILQTSYKAGACHIGSALSCVNIIDTIYKIKKKDDLFIFSKASGICALYVVLAKYEIIGEEYIPYYLKRYPLPNKEVPGVIWSGGSLGHGLPFAIGLALADRKRDIYVLMSDGEIASGTTWESILFARQHKLNNLKIYVDRNNLQALDFTENILGIDRALKMLNILFPIKVVKTTKGAGVSFLADKVESHYINLTAQSLQLALKELK